MKIKVGNKIYDSEKEPIMVILTKKDKENIANMLPEATKYCSFPSDDYWTKNNYRNINKWMDE